MESKVKKSSIRQKISVVCILLGIFFSMTGGLLYLWTEKNLTRSALKENRALVIDLGKENIAVGSLYNTSQKRIAVDKHADTPRYRQREYTKVINSKDQSEKDVNEGQ